jgi:hypothetical protein
MLSHASSVSVPVMVSDEEHLGFGAEGDEPKRTELPEDPASDEGTMQPESRRAPRGPADRSEKALGLEVARLFGLSPRLLMAPAPAPANAPVGDDLAVTDPDADQHDPPPGSAPSPPTSDP